MSNTKISDKFFKPFHKLYVKQLREVYFQDGGWKLRLAPDTILDCSMVWIQGSVVSVQENSDELILQELDASAARVKIVNYSVSGGVDNWIAPGRYVQVIGQMAGQDGQIPIVKCTKICDLSGNKQEQGMWELEVQELHNLLTNKIRFNQF